MKRIVSNYHFSLLKALISIIMILSCLGHAYGADPPKEPILRIETGMHTATIKRICVDSSEQFLVTASDDKTALVWELEKGRQKRVLRVPLDQGHEGKLYCVAISPDSEIIAAGGYSGWEWDKSCCIYIFDLSNGTIVRRITGLPNVINHVAFSKDGRYLAAVLSKENGLRIYETEAWKLEMQDTDYGSDSYWADFSEDGRLVTTSWDGYIRLYDQKFRMVSKKRGPGGEKPYSACFSPDGDRIAVGYNDSTKVDVLSGRDLSYNFSPDTMGVNKGNLGRVAWSLDGRFLYAGGKWRKGVSFFIRRWSDSGLGPHKDFEASNNTIMAALALKGKRIVFGSADPAFGILDRAGRKVFFKGPSKADYRNNYKRFKVSHEGGRVRFGFEPFGKRPGLFYVLDRTLNTSTSDNETGLHAPLTKAKGLSVTDWKNNCNPKLNGKALKLKLYEWSRSLAILPDSSGFILGTEWFVRCFDRKGKLRWTAPSPGNAWGVNVSGDGRFAIAAFGDGTIRWYNISNGEERLAFFPHRDGKCWILWTPSGYYAASVGGEDLIGWHLNRGKDKTPDFFPASRFRSVYYRPDVTAKVLETKDEEEAIRLADREAGRKTQEVAIKNILPPVVSILSPSDGSEISKRDILVEYALRTPSGEEVTGLKVLVDGRPVAMERGIKVTNTGKGESISVHVPDRDCEVSLIAENQYTASEPATIRLRWHAKTADAEEFVIKPKLYVLAIGVGQYQDQSLRLNFPAKDAKDFAEILGRQKGKLYRDVVSKVLTDNNATKDDVLDGLEWIERETTSTDIAMVFLAGHGVNDRNGNYYFLPRNANPDRLKRTGVAYHTIRDTVTNLPGKVLFFVDTCHSGNILGSKRRGDMADIDKVVNDLASAENGVVVFASSTGRQYSLEDQKWGNGAFTHALVEGLSGEADYRNKGVITVNMLDLFLSERVKELTEGQQTPTTAKPATIPDFPIAMK